MRHTCQFGHASKVVTTRIGKLVLAGKYVTPSPLDPQRCLRIRIPPWIRAQFAMTAMLSLLCAIPRPQAEFA